MAELLCNMDYIKAEYENGDTTTTLAASRFHISLSVDGGKSFAFNVWVNDGTQFAAELDVLGALIRARILKAQFRGEG